MRELLAASGKSATAAGGAVSAATSTSASPPVGTPAAMRATSAAARPPAGREGTPATSLAAACLSPCAQPPAAASALKGACGNAGGETPSLHGGSPEASRLDVDCGDDARSDGSAASVCHLDDVAMDEAATQAAAAVHGSEAGAADSEAAASPNRSNGGRSSWTAEIDAAGGASSSGPPAAGRPAAGALPVALSFGSASGVPPAPPGGPLSLRTLSNAAAQVPQLQSRFMLRDRALCVDFELLLAARPADGDQGILLVASFLLAPVHYLPQCLRVDAHQSLVLARAQAALKRQQLVARLADGYQGVCQSLKARSAALRPISAADFAEARKAVVPSVDPQGTGMQELRDFNSRYGDNPRSRAAASERLTYFM